MIYVIFMIKDDLGITMICRYKNKFYKELNHPNHINHSSDNVVIKRRFIIKPYKSITLISYLIVAIFFVFCGQDPYSRRWKEKRDKEQVERNIIMGILCSSFCPPPPPPCKVDCFAGYKTNTNDFPYGDYSLTVNGQANTAYPKTVTSNAFTTTVSLSTAISERERYYNKYYNSEKPDYSDYQIYERIRDDIANQVYDTGKNTFLEYDGDKQVEIYTENIRMLANPSNPQSINQSEIYLKITNLSTSELNTALTLNSSDTSRYFEITFQGVRYSSKYSGSTISLTLGNVPSPFGTALLTITSGTLKSSNSSSLESISISGTMTAYRQ